MPAGVVYTPTQSDTDGKTIVEVVSDSATEYGVGTEFQAVATSLGSLPAIYASTTLVLQGAIDFNDKAITNLASINDTHYFVDGYGADATGATDSRTAIINTLNAAIAAGGGVVVFGQGTYDLATDINFGSDLTGTDVPLKIVGAGAQLTTLEVTDSGTAIFDMNSDYGDVEFHDLTFTSSSSGAVTFVTNITDDTKFYRCTFTGASAVEGAVALTSSTANPNFKMVGCLFDGAYVGDVVVLYRTTNGVIDDYIFDLTTGTPDSAIYVRTSTTDNSQLQIINGHINRTAGTLRAAIDIENGHLSVVSILNPDISVSTARAAIDADSANNINIVGGNVYFLNDSNIAAVNITGDSNNIRELLVVGNGASCEAQAFGIDTVDYVNISNCVVRDFGGTTTGDVFKAATVTNTQILHNQFSNANNAVTYPTGSIYVTHAD